MLLARLRFWYVGQEILRAGLVDDPAAMARLRRMGLWTVHLWPIGLAVIAVGCSMRLPAVNSIHDRSQPFIPTPIMLVAVGFSFLMLLIGEHLARAIERHRGTPTPSKRVLEQVVIAAVVFGYNWLIFALVTYNTRYMIGLIWSFNIWQFWNWYRSKNPPKSDVGVMAQDTPLGDEVLRVCRLLGYEPQPVLVARQWQGTPATAYPWETHSQSDGMYAYHFDARKPLLTLSMIRTMEPAALTAWVAVYATRQSMLGEKRFQVLMGPEHLRNLLRWAYESWRDAEPSAGRTRAEFIAHIDALNLIPVANIGWAWSKSVARVRAEFLAVPHAG